MKEREAVPKAILNTVDGDGGRWTERGEDVGEVDLGSDGVGFGDKPGSHAVKGGGGGGEQVGREAARVGGLGGVIAGGGIGVLPGHELKGVDDLRDERVTKGEGAFGGEVLIEAGGAVVIVDGLRRVGIEGAFVDIGAIGELVGEGVEEALDERAAGGVGDQRGTLVGTRYEDVAVDVAANGLLGGVGGERGSPPKPTGYAEAVVILVRGTEVPGSEKERAFRTELTWEANREP